jgi:ribonuclease P protein component
MLRLRRKSDIQRGFDQGRRLYSPAVVLHARRREPAEPLPPLPRLAIIAGRRFPNAVARNRARRVLREACRLALAGAPAPWDLILVARPQLLTLSPQARRHAVADLLGQAGALAQEAVAVV